MKDVEMDIGGQVEEVWGHKGSFLSFFFFTYFCAAIVYAGTILPSMYTFISF